MTSEKLTKAPLNGIKTHPLTSTALANLRLLARADYPAQEFNPGVVNRLLRGDLVELIAHPSPYAIHIGRNVRINYLRITESGRGLLHPEAQEGGGS